MRRWKKKNTSNGLAYLTKLAPEEARVLRSLASYVIELLDERQKSAPQDELSELTGIPSGHNTEPDIPILQRMLPNFIHANIADDDPNNKNINSAMRSLYESDIIAAKRSALKVIVSTVPQLGGDISLNEDQARSWLQGINDLRLTLGITLNVDPDGNYAREIPAELVETVAIYDWLSVVLDLLITTITQ